MDKKISDLTVATVLSGTELVPIIKPSATSDKNQSVSVATLLKSAGGVAGNDGELQYNKAGVLTGLPNWTVNLPYGLIQHDTNADPAVAINKIEYSSNGYSEINISHDESPSGAATKSSIALKNYSLFNELIMNATDENSNESTFQIWNGTQGYSGIDVSHTNSVGNNSTTRMFTQGGGACYISFDNTFAKTKATLYANNSVAGTDFITEQTNSKLWSNPAASELILNNVTNGTRAYLNSNPGASELNLTTPTTSVTLDANPGASELKLETETTSINLRAGPGNVGLNFVCNTGTNNNFTIAAQSGGDEVEIQVADLIGNMARLGINPSGNYLMLSTPVTPTSSTASGTIGTIVWDANYIYVCVAADTWKRTALTTW